MTDPIQAGQELMLGGNYHGAQDLFLEILQDDPGNDAALYHLGLCHLASDSLAEAESCFRQCLDINPRNVDALIDLGEVEFSKGDPEQAMLSFGIAMTIDEENPRSYISLARVQDYLGLADEAVLNFEKAMLYAEPIDAPGYDLALAYAKVGKHLRAHIILDSLISDTLRRGTQALAGDTSMVAREDLNEYIQALKEDRDRVRKQFEAFHGYSIETPRYVHQALMLAQDLDLKTVSILRMEIEILLCMGIDREGRDTIFRLRNLPGQFSGHQLFCYEFALKGVLGLNSDKTDPRLKDAYEEASALLE